jgi:hypothetical protein
MDVMMYFRREEGRKGGREEGGEEWKLDRMAAGSCPVTGTSVSNCVTRSIVTEYVHYLHFW